MNTSDRSARLGDAVLVVVLLALNASCMDLEGYSERVEPAGGAAGEAGAPSEEGGAGGGEVGGAGAG
ncbi:MAG TPA: hypothetical protein PLU22_19440, partial [Polyangiaceae bacterium]|nr:hypothetical protein [Polyangiaceae bacterium]